MTALLPASNHGQLHRQSGEIYDDTILLYTSQDWLAILQTRLAIIHYSILYYRRRPPPCQSRSLSLYPIICFSTAQGIISLERREATSGRLDSLAKTAAAVLPADRLAFARSLQCRSYLNPSQLAARSRRASRRAVAAAAVHGSAANKIECFKT